MKKLILINAIVWASIILGASYLFKDVPSYEYFFFALIFCAGLMNSLLSSHSNSVVKQKCK